MHEQCEAHEERLHRLNRRLRTLSQCTSTCLQAESEQALLQSMCEILVAGGECRLAWIGYCEHDAEKTVRPVAQAGDGLDYLERVKMSWGEAETGQGPAGMAVQTGKACWVDDIRTDPRFAPWRGAALARGYAACIAVPLIAYGTSRGAVDLHGTLNLYSAECNAFDENTIEYYTGLAASVTYAVTALRSHLAEDLTYGVMALRVSEERKRAEEKLQRVQAELAYATRVMTLGEITASIAHEINQPLGAVVNNASACVRWLAAQNLEEARRSAALVIADGHRAADIIGRIRALAQKAPPHKDWLDLNALIREVIALVHSDGHRQGVALQTDLAADLPRVVGDRIQVQQVLLNLLMNALDALRGVPEGARALQISSGTDASQAVRVAVYDTGIGLAAESLAHLFDAFYTTKPEGMGLGLAISRRIIEAHGGQLWATPNTGPGATFQFTLPVPSAQQA